MKKISFTLFLPILIIALFLTSCGEVTQQTLEVDLSNSGIKSSEMGIETYKTIKDLNNFYDYNREYLSILNQGKDSLIKMPEIENDSKGLDSIIEALSYLKKTYREYNILADKAFTIDDSEFAHSIVTTAGLLEVMKPDSKADIEALIKSVGGKKFDQKSSMFTLMTLFDKILEEDVKVRLEYVNKVFTCYELALKKIPADAFDPGKIENLITEPVKGDQVKLEVYKLQLIDNGRKRKQAIEQRLYTVLAVYEELKAAHAEQVKKANSKQDLNNHILKINSMLE